VLALSAESAAHRMTALHTTQFGRGLMHRGHVLFHVTLSRYASAVSKTRMTRLGFVVASLLVVQGLASPQGREECVARQPSRVWSPIVPAAVRTRIEPAWPLRGYNDSEGTIVLDVWIDVSNAHERSSKPPVQPPTLGRY